MSQHDYVIANASGATVRADLNSLFQAMLSQNSGTSAPSTTASGMFWLDTTGGAPYTLKVRDAGNNHWLTVASITDPGSDGNLSMAAIEGSAVLSTGESGGTKFLREDGDGSCSWQSAGGGAGTVLQVTYHSTSETNALTTSYVNYWENSITLKSASSDVILIQNFQSDMADGAAFGVKIYRNSSATVTPSHTAVWTKNLADSTGPHTFNQVGASIKNVSSVTAKDTLSGFSVGNTLYYGFFARKYASTGGSVPGGDPVEDGFLSLILMEVQK